MTGVCAYRKQTIRIPQAFRINPSNVARVYTKHSKLCGRLCIGRTFRIQPIHPKNDIIAYYVK